MKVLIHKKGLSGGPRSFKDRIIKSLNSIADVKVVHDGKFDVELAFIRINKRHRRPVVLRLDGCYYESNRMGANKEILRSINNSNSLIFQSEFSKKMFRKLLKLNSKRISRSRVIHNGIDLDYTNSIDPKYEKVPLSFACAADWRTNKRPLSTLNGFLNADLDGSILYVMGKNFPKKVRDPRVRYLGAVSKEDVIGVLKSCNFLLHLCHVDSCPNIVVESLACGLSVLHTNLGGTRELVGRNGINIKFDSWNWKPIKSVRDNIPGDIVTDGNGRLISLKKGKIDMDSLSMKTCASKYVEVMRSVV